MGQQQLSSFVLCIKYFTFAMNFIYFAAGCAILGVSLWILLEKDFMSEVFGSELMTVAAILLIICGSAIVIISFFGCLGAVLENKVLILMYFIFLLILFLLMIVGGILALVFRSELGTEVMEKMKETIRDDYGVNLENSKNRAVTRAWDLAQQELHCCSVDDQGWPTYKQSEWYKIQPGVPDANKAYVPPSCCLRDQWGKYENLNKCQTYFQGPPGRPTGGSRNEALYYNGCYYRGREFVWEMSGYLVGVGIGIAISVIGGMVFAIILYVNLSRTSRSAYS